MVGKVEEVGVGFRAVLEMVVDSDRVCSDKASKVGSINIRI